MKLLTTTLAALALSTSLAFAAGMDAQVNTAQVAMGDSFQLVLTTDGQGSRPDLTPLHADFDVLGTSQSSQTQVINGRMSQSQSWIVTLAPKTQGPVTIPALTAGVLSSEPVQISVLDASQLPKSEGVGGISVQATLDGDTHYQFQEIPLTVRIETAQPLQRAELIAPNGDFELTQTGQDRSSQITRRGQPVTVVERSYLLRPQSAGALAIPPFTLRGTVADPNARRDPFGRGFGGRDPFAMMDQMMAQMGGGMMRSPFDDLFGPQGKAFAARSDALTLDVQADPSGGSDWFLPAKAVELRAEWQPETPTFRAGEAVTRRISLLALGARPEQLPDLTFPDAPGLRIYLDDTQTDLVETADGTVARKDFLISVVPTQGGELTLPELTVDWLDTASGEVKTATLPALEFSAEGEIPTLPSPPVAPVADLPQQQGGVTFWGGILGALALIGAGVWWKISGTSQRPKEADPVKPLRAALRSGDQNLIYQLLLPLRRTDRPAVEHAITRIETQSFAKEGQSLAFDLRRLTQAAIKELRCEKAKRYQLFGKRELSGLYPS